jgi:hypothetical protein
MAKFIVIAKKSGKLRVKSFNDAPDNLAPHYVVDAANASAAIQLTKDYRIGYAFAIDAALAGKIKIVS